MSLGLSHSLSRYKLKFSPDKVPAPAEPWAPAACLLHGESSTAVTGVLGGKCIECASCHGLGADCKPLWTQDRMHLRCLESARPVCGAGC